MIASPGIDVRTQEVMTAAQAQVPVPEEMVPGQSKKRATRFMEGPTVITRSMQSKKDLMFLNSTKSLPNISSLLIRALASRESDSVLTFAELKEMLGTKGYDVTRHCPGLKRNLNSLVSNGALVRMTHPNGSMFFVVRKDPEKDAEMLGNADMSVGTEEAPEVERRKAMQGVSPKLKGGAQQAKNAGQKTQEARRNLQSPSKKLQAKEKPSRRSIPQSGSAKRSQCISSATKRSSLSDSVVPSPTKKPHYSSRRAASSLEGPRLSRRQGATASSKRAKSTVRRITSKQSRCSRRSVLTSVKEQGSPYSQKTHSAHKIRCCQNENMSPPKENRTPRRKSPCSSQTVKSSMASSSRRDHNTKCKRKRH